MTYKEMLLKSLKRVVGNLLIYLEVEEIREEVEKIFKEFSE